MTTKRIFAHDVPATANATERVRAIQAEMAARDAGTTDPKDEGQMSVEEHEAAARALTEAQQAPAAIQAWHRAAIGHSKAGNHDGVLASIVHAEHLAGNHDFTPSLKRKATAADAEGWQAERIGDHGQVEIERVGEARRQSGQAEQQSEQVNDGHAERL